MVSVKQVVKCVQVGTGFSFTKDDAGYATNEVDVARDLYRYLYAAEPSDCTTCAWFRNHG